LQKSFPGDKIAFTILQNSIINEIEVITEAQKS